MPGRRITIGKPSSDLNRYQFGRFWLWYRTQRNEWCICWLEGRTTRRRSTGIGGNGGGSPPDAARQALIMHAQAVDRPVRQLATAAMFDDILADWLLEDVVGRLEAPARYAQSVRHWQRFASTDPDGYDGTVATINRVLIGRYTEFRQREGVGGHTISRDLAAIRRALTWAWKNERIAAVPHIPDVDAKTKAGPRDLVLTPEQIAAMLDAAWADPVRRHVHLYMLIQLSSHGRSKAILELDADTQIRDGLIYFNAPGRRQTTKRRAVVPVAPTLAPWLDGLTGRVIRYRAPISERRRRLDPTLPKFFERNAWDIDKAFEGCLLAAHATNSSLGLATQSVDRAGSPVWLPPRIKLFETELRPKLVGTATPNTLRHTLNTELHARGVPEAQIETAAGHVGESLNKRSYRHLRPHYLREFVEAVEAFWCDVSAFTQVHLRYQCDTKTISIAGRRANRRLET